MLLHAMLCHAQAHLAQVGHLACKLCVVRLQFLYSNLEDLNRVGSEWEKQGL